MRLVNWAWTSIKRKQESLLYLSLWLIGVPACAGILLLLLFPLTDTRSVRFSQAERWIEPLTGYGFDTASFKAMSKTAPDFNHATWTTISLPDAESLPAIFSLPGDASMARMWIRVRYEPTPESSPDEPLAIYDTRIMGGAYAVWVNGKMVYANIDGWRMQWNKPLLVKLAAQGVTAAQPADILIGVPFRVAQGYAFGSLYAGPASAIQPIHDIRYLLVDVLPRGGILVALLLGLFSFQFWLARRSETPHLLLALASVAWFVCNLQYFVDFDDNLTASRWFGYLVDASISWVVLLSFIFGFRIADREFPRLEKLLILYAMFNTLITLPLWNWEVSALVLQHYGDLLMGLGLACLYSWVALRDGRREVKVIALALWSMMLLGAYDVVFMTSQRNPDGIHTFPFTAYALFGSFMYSILRRYVEALQHVETMNASLSERLQERERELELKHRQLLEAETRQTMLLERQRLMREMHDGLGHALMSSLLLAERKQLSQEQLAGILRDCNDELKLVIGSLDPYERDLVSLLADVRERIGPRIEEAGIRIAWAMDDLPPLPWFDQSHALHVLRIVQETLTNILKHAQASEIQIFASKKNPATGMPMVVVKISDNGVGYVPKEGTHGRGLKNMRQRAQQLYGELVFDTCKGIGTTVELRLPVEIGEVAAPG